MNIMNISFSRKFDLTEENIDALLKNYGNLNINDNISIDLTDIKKSLSFIPMNKLPQFSFPLVS